jgi:hypothetical protein
MPKFNDGRKFNYDVSSLMDQPPRTLVVNNGSGSGTYPRGTVVPIVSNDTGAAFDQWTGDVTNVANISADTTTITLLDDATITAVPV